MRKIDTVLVVAAKEIRELLRDRRSMVITVVVPLLLFPLLFIVLDINIEHQTTIDEEDRIIATTGDTTVPPSYTTIRGGTEMVLRGKAILSIDEAGVIRYNDRSERSTKAAPILRQELVDASVSTADQTAMDAPTRAADPAAVPSFEIAPIVRSAGTDDPPGGVLALAAIVPLFLLLAATVSSLPAALDLGAGEKQRESLEFLLVSSAHKGAMFLGKTIATVVLGAFGTASFVVGIFVANRVAPDLLGGDASIPITSGSVAAIIVSTVLILTVIGMVQLLLSFVARSPREAQALFLPFLILVSGMGYTALLTDVWYVPGWMWEVPILNIGIFLKAVAAEGTHHVPIAWVFCENVGILGLLSYLGRRILRSEWVLRRS